jgi:hypothetical protein
MNSSRNNPRRLASFDHVTFWPRYPQNYATGLFGMRWRYPLILTTFAVVLLVVGFVYGVVMVGVPTQDPIPAIASAEARDVSTSGCLMLVGICLLVIAVPWIAIIGIAKLVRRPTMP